VNGAADALARMDDRISGIGADAALDRREARRAAVVQVAALRGASRRVDEVDEIARRTTAVDNAR
jgi:hypothetical protein